MKKYTLISPNFTPMIDGLSGHTEKVLENLSKIGSVRLITSKDNTDESNLSNVSIDNSVDKWNYSTLTKVQIDKNSDTIIQYLPFLYQKRGGINFSIIFYFLYLKYIKRMKLKFIVHELFYPFEGTLKSFIMHISHKIMLFGVLLSAEKVYVSTERFKKEIKSIFPLLESKVEHLPVASNLAFYQTEKSRNDILSEYNLPTNKKILCLFGRPHPSKRYAETLEILSKKPISFQLVFIGMTDEEVYSLNQKRYPFLTALGKLSDKQIGEIFSIVDWQICFFEDGLSTRRGSAIAALEYGVNLLSTKSYNTDNVFIGNVPIHLTNTNLELFCNKIEQLTTSDDKKFASSEIKNFYEQHFSWKNIIEVITRD